MADLADVPTDARVPLAEALLSQRLRRWLRDSPREELLARHAVALLRRSRGGATVRNVAAALGVGERRLQRAFDRTVGLGPKAFARVMRMRAVAGRIEAAVTTGRSIAWTSLAFDAGYADQSHMIREFAALAGVTPSGYAAERHRVGIVQYEPTGAT
jgi:AraC-like DNA-binding protein